MLPSKPQSASTNASSTRAVNDLLHNLRGEHFRQEQNQRRSRHQPSSSTRAHNSPSLPVAHVSAAANGDACVQMAARRARSTWLSIMFDRLPSGYVPSLSLEKDPPSADPRPPGAARTIPPLTLFCSHRLMSCPSGADFARDIAPLLPPHARRDLMRYTAVYAPLSNARLYALCEPEGHADGELIIIGPHATLRGNAFQPCPTARVPPEPSAQECADVAEPELAWDSLTLTDDLRDPPSLHTFILVSALMSNASLFALPATLTHLALIDVSAPLPVYRLSSACPLLVLLDLSYNSWLGDKALERFVWTRLSRLEVLGLRGCKLSAQTLANVNRERWTDVEIIQ